MKQLKTYTYLILLSTICISTQSLFAQYDPDRTFEFLETLQSRQDRSLADYLITELDNYMLTFPDHPNAQRAQVMQAQMYKQKGDEEKAAAAYLKGVCLYPANQYFTESSNALRRIFTTERRFKNKIEWLNQVFETGFRESQRVDQFYRYLELLVDLNDRGLRDWILVDADAFIHSFPEDPRIPTVLIWQARQHGSEGRESVADAVFFKFKTVYPNHPLMPFVLYEHGKLQYQEMNEPEKALATFNQLTAEYPDSSWAGDGMFLAAEIREKERKSHIQAIDNYRNFVNTYPDHHKVVEALWRMAKLNKDKLKAHQAAVEALQEILNRYPDHGRGPEVLEEMAGIYKSKMREYQLAAETYASISEKYPNYEKAPDRLMEAGEICKKELNDLNRAIDYYELVIDRYPGHKKARDAAKKIEKIERDQPVER